MPEANVSKKKFSVDEAVVAVREMFSGTRSVAGVAAVLADLGDTQLELVSMATRVPASRLRTLRGMAAQLV